MNIAVVFTKDITEGGAFQYALSISLLLKKNESSEYNFVFFTTLRANLAVLSKYGLEGVYLPWSNFDRIKSFLSGSQLLGNIFTKVNAVLESRLDKIFKKQNIDLVYFLSPTDLALTLNRFNYIFTVWDLCFLSALEFPEVYLNREFERRQSLYSSAVSRALTVITDSQTIKNEIIKKYGAREDRVVSLPFLPLNAKTIFEGEYARERVDINKKYNITGRYVFYPAQFWPHKNHIYILDGLKLLKEKYKVEIHALFAGSDKGNLDFILNRASQMGISGLVHYIGFVDNSELPYLYAQAQALVMPTYFGPTNIPPLEAFAAGCPVLYSDLPGIRQEMGDSVILLDLNDPDSFCQGVLRVIKGGLQINTLVENGKKRIESLIKEDHWRVLKLIFDNFAVRRRTCRR